MPATRVAFFRERSGESAIISWLRQLRKQDRQAWANCRARIELLARFGHELRRPAADYLRDGIYELRAKRGHVQYRILYFFHGRNVVILSHGLTKEDKVPDSEIERAKKRKLEFETNPQAHTYEQEIGDQNETQDD